MPDRTGAGIGDSTLPARWARQWAADPGGRALRMAGATAVGSWCTYAELDGRSRDAAQRLAAQGLSPGDRVLISARPSIETVVAMVAVLRMGAVAVPVNPSATAREVVVQAADVQPSLAIIDEPSQAAAVADAAPRAMRCTVALERIDDGGTGTRSEPTVLLDGAAPEDPALMVYTSGTTGSPKGAVLSHRNLAAGTASVAGAWRWLPTDRLVLALPLFHVHGLCAGLFGGLAAGSGAIVFERFDAGAVLRACAADATMFFGVPTMYHRMLGHADVTALGSLRLCVSGSAPLPPPLWGALRAEAGVEVLERYGMTETLLTLSNPYDGERRPGTVGFPLPGVSIRIGELSGRPGTATTDGPSDSAEAEGELFVSGPTVFSGYWGRPAATQAVLSSGWFATGDIVAADADGYVSIRGRRDDLIISGGHNVYPAEVEDVLIAHPAVAEVAVTGVPSADLGQVVTAWIVADGRPPTLEELRAVCADRLAPHKHPRDIRVVEALPRNALGKIQRGQLR